MIVFVKVMQLLSFIEVCWHRQEEDSNMIDVTIIKLGICLLFEKFQTNGSNYFSNQEDI